MGILETRSKGPRVSLFIFRLPLITLLLATVNSKSRVPFRFEKERSFQKCRVSKQSLSLKAQGWTDCVSVMTEGGVMGSWLFLLTVH